MSLLRFEFLENAIHPGLKVNLPRVKRPGECLPRSGITAKAAIVSITVVR